MEAEFASLTALPTVIKIENHNMTLSSEVTDQGLLDLGEQSGSRSETKREDYVHVELSMPLKFQKMPVQMGHRKC